MVNKILHQIFRVNIQLKICVYNMFDEIISSFVSSLQKSKFKVTITSKKIIISNPACKLAQANPTACSTSLSSTDVFAHPYNTRQQTKTLRIVWLDFFYTRWQFILCCFFTNPWFRKSFCLWIKYSFLIIIQGER